MTDRHSLSEPRYLGDFQWEVDVYRDGVPQPVDTLPINVKTLPPRKNRKGKIVWQLPKDPMKQVLSFGTEDKKRVFEIFKERKKQRKKEKALITKQQTVNNDSTQQSQSQSEEVVTKDVDPSDPAKETETASKDTEQKQEKEILMDTQSNHSSTVSDSSPVQRSSPKKKSRSRGRRGAPSSKKASNSNSGDANAAKQEENKRQSQSSNTSKVKDIQDPGETSADLVPNSDEQKNATLELKSTEVVDSSIGLEDSLSKEKQDILDKELSNHSNSPIFSGRPRKSFQSDRNGDGVTSTSVSIAKQFVDIYYSMITKGFGGELAHYYTDSAQKSISVGGAHSVVTGYDSVAKQLMSFRGAFSSRGIVAQDTVDGGVHLLVTGLYVPMDNGIPCPFAHTVVLTSVNCGGESASKESFQIHNDAFALISTDVPIMAPSSTQPLNSVPPFAPPSMPPPGFG